MGTQFNPCSEANCSSMKVLFFVALCLSNASVFGYHGSGSGMGSGMPGECCPLKAIMGNPDPSKNGLYMFAGYADRALPWECEGSPCLYTMAGYGGQKYCMAPSDESEVKCFWEGMGSGMNGYGSGMSGYGSMMSGYGSMMSGYGSMMSGYGGMMSGYGSMMSGYGSGTSGYGSMMSGSGSGEIAGKKLY